MAKQVRTDLALFKRRKVDAVEAARQRLGQVGLAHAQESLRSRRPHTSQTPLSAALRARRRGV